MLIRLNFLLITFCCFYFSTGNLHSQSIYDFKNFTINEGLSQSSALCFIQDDNYGLWVGTQDGLNRFDGKTFEIYTAEETKGFGGNYIHAIIADNKGDLWIASGNGLIHRNKKTDAFTTYNPSKEQFSIESIAISHDNKTIWMATSREGIWAFDLKSKTFSPMTSIFPSRQTKNVFISTEGIIFVAAEDRPLEAYNPKTGQLKKITFASKNDSEVAVNCLYQLSAGELFIGTNQGIFKCIISTFQTLHHFQPLDKQHGYLNVSGILKTADNYWYITTINKGLFTIYPDGNIINSTQDIFQKNALLYNSINSIYEDKNKTIWLGTSRGISGFNPINQGFLGIAVSADLKHGLPSPSVWCIRENKTFDALYIGTDLGISRFDKKKREFIHFNKQDKIVNYNENDEISVLDFLIVSDKLILTACLDGIYELRIEPNGTYKYNRIPFLSNTLFEQHKRAYKIVHYKNNSYFFATKAGALLIDYDKKTATEFVYQPNKINASILPGICRLAFKDSQGRIFFASSSGGLSVLDDKNGLIIRPYDKNKALSGKLTSYFTSMAEIKPGEFYLGTGGDGVVHWSENTGKAFIYGKNQGLPNNVVYASVLDNQNNIWLSTNKGLSRFNLKTKETQNFTEIHGLLSNEFNMGAGIQAKSGRLYFGGIAGLVFFDPESLTNYNFNVDVVLTKFKLDNQWLTAADKNSPLNQSISYTDELILNYRQRSFTIRFQTDNLSNTELINYKYLLEGSNEGEIEVGNINELRFNSLSPGEYTLKLYARVGFGKWISQPRILKITIKPPFWNTWWFWTLAGILTLIIIRFSIRKRIDHERREQVRLEMKIAERTTEIRAQNIKIEKQKEILEKQSKQLEIEKEKSERLLRNVIPDSMADELLEKGEASARAFKVVSIMFTDFVGFTKIADTMKPGDLVKKLDIFFRKFDEIVFNNNLERIKTIGDAYMAAGGVPVRNNTNPIDTCLAGLQIQHYIKNLQQESIDAGEDETVWRLRLGINTGEVTAGVIGSKRLAYDVWGSTVNYAQRMEMLGEADKVTITYNTYLHIEPYFECTYKGQVSAKGEGKIQMYQVERIKPELSIDGLGIYPNERFHKIVNLHHYSSINYYKAERFIMKKLEKELSDKLHYHSIDHTRDVVQAVERLALSENVTDEGLFLLKTAASYHDAGFVEQYDKNEPIGVRMASEILPKYGYTPEHIDYIKELIFVTSVPHKPNNLLEEIICDADLDYLGRDDFHEIADRLRKELREHGRLNSDRKWDEIQVLFLSQHQFFTKTAKRTRDPKKAQNLQEIKDRLLRNEYKD